MNLSGDRAVYGARVWFAVTTLISKKSNPPVTPSCALFDGIPPGKMARHKGLYSLEALSNHRVAACTASTGKARTAGKPRSCACPDRISRLLQVGMTPPLARLQVKDDDVPAVPANVAQQRYSGHLAPIAVFVVESGHHELAPVVWAVGHFDESVDHTTSRSTSGVPAALLLRTRIVAHGCSPIGLA
jgi:hypothetical protein